MGTNFNNLFVLLSLVACSLFAVDESLDLKDADTFQGFTPSAFITTNDFEHLKIAIERLKSNAESCADTIVDLQLGLSGLSNEERIVV